MKIKTAAQLIQEIEDACAGADPTDVPVRIAGFGSHSAFSYHISSVVAAEDDPGTIYIGEGDQENYLPTDIRNQF